MCTCRASKEGKGTPPRDICHSPSANTHTHTHNLSLEKELRVAAVFIRPNFDSSMQQDIKEGCVPYGCSATGGFECNLSV